ncbi:hypothetical protein [Aliikangiella sp. G2MR2-5]|uniref:hypothetical protein n=1 Tax=Aliikangiella sp. G2MR2-5 TaxID=2788943 RepID=UPI0018AABBCE|nr:hypothetical protein [Aliikangiella sp. G2MR2-5]
MNLVIQRAFARLNKVSLVLLTTGITLAICGQVQAHKFLSEILTEQNLGSNAYFVHIANYQLTEEEILNINNNNQRVDYYLDRTSKLVAVKQKEEDTCENSGFKTCGQFDHFSQARSAAIITCHQLYEQNPSLYPATLVPLYLSPTTFVELDTATNDHHINYNLVQGLSFDCGYITWVLKYEQDS